MKSTSAGAGLGPGGSAAKKRKTSIAETQTTNARGDASTRLRTECALAIERAHEPRDVLRAMEDLTPEVLHQWPELRALLARRVVSVCRNDTEALQTAIGFCLPAAWGNSQDPHTALNHPWGSEAQEILRLWIQQADSGILLRSAQSVLGHVVRHLQQLSQQAWPDVDLGPLNAACTEALQRLNSRAAGYEGVPQEVWQLVFEYLIPPLSQSAFEAGFANGLGPWVHEKAGVYCVLKQVNHAFDQFVQPLLPRVQDIWVRGVAAQLEHLSNAHLEGDHNVRVWRKSQHQMRAQVQHSVVQKAVSVWDPSVWRQLMARLPLVWLEESVGVLLLNALLSQADRQQTVHALTALLDAAADRLTEGEGESLDLARSPLATWPRRILAQAYRQHLAPQEETFKQVIDAVRLRAWAWPPAARACLLLELAALSLRDAERLMVVVNMVDGLREEQTDVPIDWEVIGDCLEVLQGRAQQLSAERLREVLKYLLQQPVSTRGASFALGLSAIAQLPVLGANEELLSKGIVDLMTQATSTWEGVMPQLYPALFELFSGERLMAALDTAPPARLPKLLAAMLYPATQANLPMWRIFSAETPPQAGTMSWLKKALNDAKAGDAEVRTELQALWDGIKAAARHT